MMQRYFLTKLSIISLLIVAFFVSALDGRAETIETRAFINSLKQGWEIKDKFFFGSKTIEIADGELSVCKGEEVCWTAGSAE